MNDEKWMRRALELAERGRGRVEPNPLVGAVVVQGDRLVSEGWHAEFGGPHAEVAALEAASEFATGATLYVTLEPCCHFGKTPPCTEAILEAGVARVVAAMADPFPRVDGGGLRRLREAGLDVSVGVLEAEARRLNAPYLKRLSKKLPYVHVKWAMTADGKIASRCGRSKWISSRRSRAIVHELRGRMDAIIVGVGTALRDDPLLTARPPGPRTPVRVVFDSHGRLPLESTLVRTAREVPVIIAGTEINSTRQRQYENHGCRVVSLEQGGAEGVVELLRHLAEVGCTNVLVEGGAGLLGSFLDAGEIDELHLFIAPRLLGGEQALSPIAGLGFDSVDQGLQLEPFAVQMVDGDLYLRSRVLKSR